MASTGSRRTKFILDEDRIPRAWYNIAADLPDAAATRRSTRARCQPIGPADLAPLFPMALISRRSSAEREIEIPEPGPRRLRALPAAPAVPRPPAREGARYAGPHLLQVRGRAARPAATSRTRRSPRRSTTRRRASTRLATETGAGQWGSALAFAGAVFGLEVKVYMVRASYDQKPYRRILMETYGAQVVASPSADDELRPRRSSARRPTHRARSGIAISEAVEDAATRDDTKYSLGSVLNHVLLHQTVIGQEAMEQMAMAGEEPDVIIGCAGGGSNFAGLTFPFLGQQLRGGRELPDHRRRARGGARR